MMVRVWEVVGCKYDTVVLDSASVWILGVGVGVGVGRWDCVFG